MPWVKLQLSTFNFQHLMKILLLGEYSNVHNTLAKGLRALGHHVTVASNGDYWKNYPRDIDLARRSGRVGGMALYAKILKYLPRMRGYDVVQLINPLFIDLSAKRLFHIYNYIRKHNRKMVMGGFGMDYYWVSTCLNDKPLRYSDFNIGEHERNNKDAIKEIKDWIGTDKEKLNRMIATDCDAIVTGLYEYWVCYKPAFPDKTSFIPFPIVTSEKEINCDMQDATVKVFIGISKNRSEYKGTDIMLRAAKHIKEKHPEKMELYVVEGVPFNEYVMLMNSSDIIMDQLYSYTPAMNALQAMSQGLICMGGGEEENYEILNEKELRPIINVQPTYESVCKQLEYIVLHPELIPSLKKDGIEYIKKHHDHIKVAKKYEALYNKLLDKS